MCVVLPEFLVSSARVRWCQRTLRTEVETVKKPLDFALAVAISEVNSQPIVELIVTFDCVLVFPVAGDLGRIEVAESDRVGAGAAARRCRQITRDRKEVREDGGARDVPVFHAKSIGQPESISGPERRAEIKEKAGPLGGAGDVVLTKIQDVWRDRDRHCSRGRHARERGRWPPGDTRIPIDAAKVLDEGKVRFGAAVYKARAQVQS